MKISVITPTFNSGKFLEKAICSVLDQDYVNYEHIIIDGGSTDQSLDILANYPHLIWTSEKDRGQVHAMNKGFAKATGEIIVYLNADDYFLCGAFSSVIPFFKQNHKVVVGDIIVQKPNEYFINVPKVRLAEMIRHWEMNAFPYNPVGYFYRREVQEAFPFDEQFPNMMDLRFLLEAVTKYEFKKINALLGVYRCFEKTKTIEDQQNENYWTVKNFNFINKYLNMLPNSYQHEYKIDRISGYNLQKKWQKNVMNKNIECNKKTFIDKKNNLITKFFGKKIVLPSNKAIKGHLTNDQFTISKNSPVILIYQTGKVGSSSIYSALINNNTLPVYHIHYLSEKRLQEAFYWHEINKFPYIPEHLVISKALQNIISKHKNDIRWKIITLARDPIALQASVVFQNLNECFSEIIDHSQQKIDFVRARKLIIDQLSDHNSRKSHFINWFDYELNTVFGVNIYDYPFDPDIGYNILSKNNIDVLLIKLEKLNECYKEAFEKFLGFKNIDLPRKNIGKAKKYGNDYKELMNQLALPVQLCNSVYNTKYSQYFYSKSEISDLTTKWTTTLSNHKFHNNFSKTTESDLLPYQKKGVDRIENFTSIANKSILELGGDIHATVANEFVLRGAGQVTSLNTSQYFKEGRLSNKICLKNMDARRLSLPDGSYDIAFGAAVLEHFNNFDLILEQLYKVMKPNSYIYLHGAPLWTSHVGHHLWLHIDNEKYEFNGNNPIPDWAHLTSDYDQIFNLLVTKNLPDIHCKLITDFIFKSDKINRYTPTDIYNYILESDFILVEFNKFTWKSVPAEIITKVLKKNKYLSEDLGVSALEIVLKKE
ncbi:MAG: glycosyltransferase [Desulfobulbaceae bacterium]|jgi:glycosyltransferase involved in cell wall biosynthesis/SAM-dependent methyltransferase